MYEFVEASFLEYWPSCIAAATILCAANDLPNFSLVNAEHAESWCGGLIKVRAYIYIHVLIMESTFHFGSPLMHIIIISIIEKIKFPIFAGKNHQLLPVNAKNHHRN